MPDQIPTQTPQPAPTQTPGAPQASQPQPTPAQSPVTPPAPAPQPKRPGFLSGLFGQPMSRANQPNQLLQQQVGKGSTELLDIIAPAAFSVTPNFIQLNNFYIKTFFVYTYPRFLNTNWLSPVINFDIPLDISMFIYPLETKNVMSQLRRKQTQLEATQSIERDKGLVRDPELDTAITDIDAMRDILQKGESRIFQLALYFTIYATSPEELETLTRQLESTLGGMLIYTKQAFLQMEPGFDSTVPLANDRLQIIRNLDTASLSTTFPFTSATLTSNQGILYGINRHNNSLVLFDRFNLENGNSVIFGTSGSGKSIAAHEPVLIRERGIVKRVEIGSYVDKLLTNHPIVRDAELEGVINPSVEVFGFDHNLKSGWHPVTVAGRQPSPSTLYQVRTASGRSITTTDDHNLVILKDGLLQATRAEHVKKGDFTVVPRSLPDVQSSGAVVDLFELLQNNPRLYIYQADHIARLVPPHQGVIQPTIDRRFDRYLYHYRQDRPIPLPYFLKLLDYLAIDRDDQRLTQIRFGSKSGRTSLPRLLPLTPSLVRLLGYLVAEGTITDTVIVISSQSLPVRNDITRYIRSIDVPWVETKSAIRMNAPVLVCLINQLGVGQGAGAKRVPPIIFSLSNQLVAQFLKAYGEGDGGVEKNVVTYTTKSAALANEILWLLCRFSIIGRISWRTKRATNSQAVGRYALITISGQNNLQHYAQKIGFVSLTKARRLKKIINRSSNPNVDVIPTLTPLLQKLQRLTGYSWKKRLGQQLRAITTGFYRPTPAKLLEIIEGLENQLKNLTVAADRLEPLTKLPHLETIINQGANNRIINHRLWQTLGQSWRLMKNQLVIPKTKNVIRAYQAITGQLLDIQAIKQDLSTLINLFTLPRLAWSGRTMGGFLTNPERDCQYPRLEATVRNITGQVQQRLYNLSQANKILQQLKTLATSDLFFDPVVEITEVIPRHPYVYDLTVDCENFTAGYGALFVHNSYSVKLEALRYMMLGTDVIVIDPEYEYRSLAEAVGGSVFHYSLNSRERINPFDLPPTKETDTGETVLRGAVAMLTGLIGLMVGSLTPEEQSILDKAIYETYALKDITTDPQTHQNPAPILSDLVNVLKNISGAQSMIARLTKFTEGSFAGLLNQPTNFTLDKGFVVFSIRDLEDQLRPIAMYTILTYIWNKIRQDLRRRLLIIDEAWVMMQHEDSARFVHAIAKRARKYYLGLTIISQDVEDFIESSYGRSVINNSAMQFLMKQSTTSIDKIADLFKLTEGEKFLLLESDVGEGLFFAGQNHVAIKVIASYTEDQLVTTDPRQILEMTKNQTTQSP